MNDFPELMDWYRAKQALPESESEYWDAGEALARAIERRMKLSQALNAKDGE